MIFFYHNCFSLVHFRFVRNYCRRIERNFKLFVYLCTQVKCIHLMFRYKVFVKNHPNNFQYTRDVKFYKIENFLLFIEMITTIHVLSNDLTLEMFTYQHARIWSNYRKGSIASFIIFTYTIFVNEGIDLHIFYFTLIVIFNLQPYYKRYNIHSLQTI